MKTNEQRLDDLMNFIDSLSRINTADIPDINLYMDSGDYLYGLPSGFLFKARRGKGPYQNHD